MGLTPTSWFRSSWVVRYFDTNCSCVNKPVLTAGGTSFCRIKKVNMAMLGDVLHVQCYARFPARSPVVRPVTAVNKAVTQVRRAIRAVAQVPLLVNQSRVFIDRESVVKRPGKRCYSSGQYPPDFVTTNLQVPSVIGVMCYASLVLACKSIF